MRLSSGKELEDVSLNMTPMIDIVFLLIIFFVTVSELARLQQLDLELPLADQANPDDLVKPDRLVVNMEKSGKVSLHGIEGLDTESSEFAAILQREARQSTSSGVDFAMRQVILRGDKRARFGEIQKFMLACRRAGIWQLEFRAGRPEGADAARDERRQ